jgi:hypothetical protein
MQGGSWRLTKREAPTGTLLVGASTARPNGGTTVNQEKAGHVSNGLIGTIIGVLVVVILVILILNLT